MIQAEYEQLYQKAFIHADHLCNGLCPDDEGPGSPGLDSRDPECFYCGVLVAVEELSRDLSVMEDTYNELLDAVGGTWPN